MTKGLHHGQPVFTAGDELSEARSAIILLHGRDARPESMLELAEKLDVEDCAVLAPRAKLRRWYPKGFMKAIAHNEPDLSSALHVVTTLVRACNGVGIPTERIVIGGFSQGACLATEWVIRHPARYGGVVALSGGLIGPPGELTRADGSLEGTPVFIGCSEEDPWIPMSRVHETSARFEMLGGRVDLLTFPGDDHSIRADEIDRFNQIIEQARNQP